MKHILLLVSLVITIASQSTHAQPPGPDERKPFERIEHFKKVRLIEMLDMKEEQSVRFFARLNEHDNTKRDLMKEKMDVLDKIERLVRNHAEEKEFEKLFPEVAALNEKLAQEDQKFFSGLSDIISAEQRGKYLLFERQFERELREAMRDIQHRRMRMGQQ
jgi:molybdopterin converting factor small subunit